MQNAQLESIETEALQNVIGGADGGGWLGMLSGGKTSLGSILGGSNASGGMFGLNKEGKGKGLAEGISGLLTGGGGGGIQSVEGKDHQGFGG